MGERDPQDTPSIDPTPALSSGEWIDQGIASFRAGDLASATRLWRRAVEAAPQDERARAYLSWGEWRRRELGIPSAEPDPAASTDPSTDDSDPVTAEYFASPFSSSAASTVGGGSAGPAIPLAGGHYRPRTGGQRADEPVRAFLSRTPTRPDLQPLDVPEITDEVITALASFAGAGGANTPRTVEPGVIEGCLLAASRALDAREYEDALAAAERAVQAAGGPDAPAARDHARELQSIYGALIGDRCRTVRLGSGSAPDARAAFLLSRVDGTFSIEDLVEISGMSSLEATRLIALLLRGGVLAA